MLSEPSAPLPAIPDLSASLFPDVIITSVLPEFHGLDEAMLLRALQALQQEHKAEIITLDDGRGVKFF